MRSLEAIRRRVYGSVRGSYKTWPPSPGVNAVKDSDPLQVPFPGVFDSYLPIKSHDPPNAWVPAARSELARCKIALQLTAKEPTIHTAKETCCTK